MFGFLSSTLCDRFGCGYVMSMGGAFIGLGVLTSSFAPNAMTLFITYGIVVSIGTSCLFFSSLLVLPLYFNRKLGLANGIVSAGSGVGGIALSPLFGCLIKSYGLRTTFQTYAILAVLPLLGGFLIRRRAHYNDPKQKRSSCFDRQLLSNKAFVLFTVAMSLILFVYYIPYVHLINFSCIKGVKSEDAALLPSVISASAVIGKFLFGYIGQLRKVNRLYMFQGFLLLLSVSLTMLPLTVSYLHLLLFSIVFGLSEGGFSSYIIICMSQTVYTKQLAAAFGMMYTVTSFFSLFGAPFAGLVFDATGKYEIAFLSCGAIFMIGALSLFFLPFLIPEDVYYERIRIKRYLENVSDKIKPISKMTENSNAVIVFMDYIDPDVSEKAALITPKLMHAELDTDDNKQSIFSKNKSLYGKSSVRYSSTDTLYGIINKYLDLPDIRKTRSMMCIPPYARQDFINNYVTEEEPVVV
ncbi:monocarboxylate transporter 13-like isoform X2 [Hydractinia symbiolongicarpus]|nr:monocarboxylate transporter 13-like isoform X2 [Hydractinia symbiolongicarpus]